MKRSAIERATERVMRSSQQLARQIAGQLLQEKRAKAHARKRARELELRRKLQLGAAVISAGLSEWDITEVRGVLLEAKERVGRSPTMRMAARKRGEQQAFGTATRPPLSVPAPTGETE